MTSIKDFMLLAFSSQIFQTTIALASNKLEWLRNSISQKNPIDGESKDAAGELAVKRFKSEMGTEGSSECSVCLCGIEEGDEIRELNCHHLFHRVCLDRWVGYGRVTCPLCRRSVAPAGRMAAEHGGGLVLLKFQCLSTTSQNRTSWWLR
nr:E3 ubiquitin-protein ligase RHA2B-like [Ipomoea trifida]